MKLCRICKRNDVAPFWRLRRKITNNDRNCVRILMGSVKYRLTSASYMRHNYIYITADLACDANTWPKCGKDEDSSPARRPQSAPGGDHRSAIPDRRVLRPPGFPAGQVRDASPCRGRQSPRDRSRSRLRAVAPRVLSGPACGGAAGPCGIDSSQARPAWIAQTYACRLGLCPSAACGIPLADDRRTDHTHPAAIRRSLTPAHHRTAY